MNPAGRDSLPAGVEVRLSEVAGLRLLELVRGFTRVMIIDTLKSTAEAGRSPGEIVRYEAKDVEILSEEFTPVVAAAAKEVLTLVRREVAV